MTWRQFVRIAILIKQIPALEAMELGPDGRLVRDSVRHEMNAYCRRAVSLGVELAKVDGDSTTTVFTLGPPSALDVIREAIGWGVDEGVLVSDPQFAGSDTVATTNALAAAISQRGPFDLILVGRNSLDADTGQVGPGIAEFFGWSFLPSVKEFSLEDGTVTVLCEEDDGESDRCAALPLVIACAERLIEPCKVKPERWPELGDPRITTVSAGAIGAGPWGAQASPTTVGEVRVHDANREKVTLEGPPLEIVTLAVSMLERRGAFTVPEENHAHDSEVAQTPTDCTRRIGVVVEPHRPEIARELLGEANELAVEIDASVVAITVGLGDARVLSSWGADQIEALEGDGLREHDVAEAVSRLVATKPFWAMLLPSTAWGREVAGRVSVRLGTGLTGDALEFGLDHGEENPVLIAWKSALGGQLLVAIRSSVEPQMATVRPGALALRTPRAASSIDVNITMCEPLGGVEILAVRRNDDVEEVERATHVIGVGTGVDPDEYDTIERLAKALGATVVATRKVTDRGWMPRSRQIGITGRSIRPHLYVAVGLSGSFNHAVGVRSADTILAINSDPSAPIFRLADVGIVGDWQEIVPLFEEAVRSRPKI